MAAKKILNELAEAGFTPAATLRIDEDRRYTFDFIDAGRRDVIYAYIDVGGSRILNIGHTGQLLRSRLKSYEAWLNGHRVKENNRPIRLSWLACFENCAAAEVWAIASSPDKAERERHESELIARFRPVLNIRP